MMERSSMERSSMERSSIDVAIEAGAELDRAVAEACGPCVTEPVTAIRCKQTDLERVLESAPGGGMIQIESADDIEVVSIGFHPSTDLNAAFAAAERVSGYFAVTKNDCSEGLWECKLSPHDDICEWGRAETPALAICAAILKLKESGDARPDQPTRET